MLQTGKLSSIYNNKNSIKISLIMKNSERIFFIWTLSEDIGKILAKQ
jgi:predicted RNA-binding protein YlqC (UPF0109 family)